MDFKFWRKKPEKRELQYVTAASQSLGGLNLTDYSGMNFGAFFQGVELISNSVANLDIKVKKRDGKGKTTEIKNSPINLLFNDPNNLLSKSTMIRQIITSIIVKGNGFCYINRGADGTPVSLRFVESCDVTINYDKQRNTLYYNIPIIKSGKIMPNDVLHFKVHSWDGVKGISVLGYANKCLSLATATEEQARDFFSNGCNQLTGILTVQSQLSKEQREQILNSFGTTYSRGGKGLCVLQGNMQYSPLSINASDSQLLESREYNAADICRFLNINPSMIGLKGYSKYTSFEDDQNEFLVRTLMPYIICLEDEMNRKLLTNNNQKIIFDTEDMLRINKQAQASYYTSMHTNGLMTCNEIRHMLGLPDVEGGDTLTIAYSDPTQNAINKDTTTDDTQTEEQDTQE